jgi:NhaA family Na+:H+ antiporter
MRGFPIWFVAGSFIWLAVDGSGIHATVAGVILGLLTPDRRCVSDERLYATLDQVVARPAGDEGSADRKDRQTLQVVEIATRETLSPVERLEYALHPWVGFVIMPLFAFAGAGLPLSSSDLGDAVTLAVCMGFAVGKPIGILAFCWLAVRTGITTRPRILTGDCWLVAVCSPALALPWHCSSPTWLSAKVL